MFPIFLSILNAPEKKKIILPLRLAVILFSLLILFLPLALLRMLGNTQQNFNIVSAQNNCWFPSPSPPPPTPPPPPPPSCGGCDSCDSCDSSDCSCSGGAWDTGVHSIL